MGFEAFQDDSKYKDIISKRSKTELDLLKQFENQKNWIGEISQKTKIDTDDVKKRVEKAKKDYAFFVKTYLSHHCLNEVTDEFIHPAYFHINAANEVAKDGNFIGLFQWARNHAKTTTSMFILLWMIIRGEVHNLVYVSKSKDFSITQLQNIQAELEYNLKLISDFGVFKEKGAEWRADRFVIPSRNLACSAIGRGSSPRGIKYKKYRPDFIIIDDIDDDENSRNPKRVRQLISWWNSELKPTTSLKYKILVIGNKFSNESLISHFEKNIPDIYKDRIDALDLDNNPAWKERFTKEYLLREKEIMGRIAFEREYMNNPIIEGLMFQAENIHLKSMNMPEYKSVVLYIDPSWSDTSDYKCVVAIGKLESEFHVVDLYLKKSSMSAMIDWCYKFYLDNYIDVAIKVFMEGNAGQNYLKNEFDFAEKQYKITLPLILDRKNKIDKYARIEAMTPYFERNMVYFNEKLENTKELSEAIAQLLAYEKAATINDDFPDALEGAIKKINIYQGDRKRMEAVYESRDEEWDW